MTVFHKNAAINSALHDLVDEVVVGELRDLYNDLSEPAGVPRFSFDPDEEAQQTKKLRKAVRLVAEHYGAKL
jgi:hypothetical protein